MTPPNYTAIAEAVAEHGFIARGGFVVDERDNVPDAHPGVATHTVIIIGNAGRTMWPHFVASNETAADPLDTWTRHTLQPVADRFGAGFVHPSDEPYQPFQQWAQRAEPVHRSPIGIFIHPAYGLWHAYRGALLFAQPVDGLPTVPAAMSPCATCADQPCLTACPVDAIGEHGLDPGPCLTYLSTRTSSTDTVERGADLPDCMHTGCAARCSCPIATDTRYDPPQMHFHMRAFAGLATALNTPKAPR